MLYRRRSRNGAVIELVWSNVSAIFPFDSEVIDKDLFELFHVFERCEKRHLQIGLYVEMAMFAVGKGYTQDIIVQGLTATG